MKKADLLIDQKCSLGEGPIWIADEQKLYWVDILGKKIFSANSSGEDIIAYDFPDYVSNIYDTDSPGILIVALSDGLHIWDTEKHEVKPYALFENYNPELRTNDGFCDPNGNLWIGTMALTEEDEKGTLYMLDANKEWHEMLTNVSISNGIRANTSGNEIYYIDTPTHLIRQFNFSQSENTWTFGKNLSEIDNAKGHPDGMAMDTNGNFWVALWDGNCVVCIDPSNGKIIDEVAVDAPHVSACIFGGKNLSTLFITTARKDMSDEELEQFPSAGGIFKIELGISGSETYKVRLT
ncbi:SMP-30/gluconolactonase/LRE family protein [Membranihabitans maritimus]|uniref:SMP-30/gluconolactonase/LRE family protein n=1 Tax=Membranihabitans maritimus TaxID=2904244 RepID=UPI001F19EC23|nr:SMP-30/gluconolactonase/LRE family protein [Membranihabitans maritimus]